MLPGLDYSVLQKNTYQAIAESGSAGEFHNQALTEQEESLKSYDYK
jgi:hypothetical protein